METPLTHQATNTSTTFFDLVALTLIFDINLDILPPKLHAEIQLCLFVRLPAGVVTHTQTYVLRRHMTHTDVCSLCATRNGMKALFAPPIFHTYEATVVTAHRSTGNPEFFKKYSLPCAPWCTLRLGGAYCGVMVNKAPVYHCSGA